MFNKRGVCCIANASVSDMYFIFCRGPQATRNRLQETYLGRRSLQEVAYLYMVQETHYRITIRYYVLQKMLKVIILRPIYFSFPIKISIYFYMQIIYHFETRYLKLKIIIHASLFIFIYYLFLIKTLLTIIRLFLKAFNL